MADAKMTDQQRCHIFALGRERGLDKDALRAMTPTGSIKDLTRDQASVLIDAIKHGRSPDYSRRPRMPRGPKRPRKQEGVIRLASDAQRKLIEVLRVEIGWTREQFQAWLEKRHFAGGKPMTEYYTGEEAEQVIELLKHVRDKMMNGGQRSAANRVIS